MRLDVLLLSPDVRRRLLITLVVAEGHRHLVHVHRPVQLLQRILVRFLAHVAAASGLLVRRLASRAHVAREESAFVKLASLIHTLFGGRVELDHHRGVHLRARRVESGRIQVVECRHPSGGLALTSSLVKRYALKMLVILFLAAEGKLGALVELFGVAFTGDVHHQ